MNILVTGGAGFIGSHLVDTLVELGHEVTVFDNLDTQVHTELPAYLRGRFVYGDVRDNRELRKVVSGQDHIFHFASAVGVGQSQYEIARYTEVNVMGTANLLQILSEDPIPLTVAASMSSYGEGVYWCVDCGMVRPALRSYFCEPSCPKCGNQADPMPTHEDAEQNCNSIYAFNKRQQEEMCVHVGGVYGFPVTSLRFFNVYGPRQSLSNPYSGVMAIFMSRLKNGNKPVIYEDGKQTRDFISVHDVVTACLMTMGEKGTYNVGTGNATPIGEVAQLLARVLGSDNEVEIGSFRHGDVRHCYAGTTKMEELGFVPEVSLFSGIEELVAWASEQPAVDRFDTARAELVKRGIEV